MDQARAASKTVPSSNPRCFRACLSKHGVGGPVCLLRTVDLVAPPAPGMSKTYLEGVHTEMSAKLRPMRAYRFPLSSSVYIRCMVGDAFDGVGGDEGLHLLVDRRLRMVKIQKFKKWREQSHVVPKSRDRASCLRCACTRELWNRMLFLALLARGLDAQTPGRPRLDVMYMYTTLKVPKRRVRWRRAAVVATTWKMHREVSVLSASAHERAPRPNSQRSPPPPPPLGPLQP